MKLLERLGQNLVMLGIPGLFLISFLDSAAVPMVGGPDALLLLLSWQKPHLFWLSALAATAGSALGCIVLHRIGRAGGDVALSRFSREKRERVREMLDRNAFSAVFIAVIAPPPFPTKLLILTAGAFRMGVGAMTVGVLAGRLIRYGIEAWIGARFGDQGAALIKQHYTAVGGGLVALVGLILLVRWFWTRDKGTTEPRASEQKTEE